MKNCGCRRAELDSLFSCASVGRAQLQLIPPELRDTYGGNPNDTFHGMRLSILRKTRLAIFGYTVRTANVLLIAGTMRTREGSRKKC